MFERWARWWVNRYAWALEGRPYIDREDLYQSAMLGILRAQACYKSDKGSWAQFSSYYVRYEIRRLIGIKQGRIPPQAVPLDAPMGDDPDGDTRLDLLPDETALSADEAAEYDELVRAVREAVAQLTDNLERRVVQLHRLEGKSIPETAEALNITETDARRLDRTARFKHLANDKHIRALVHADDMTPYYNHVGVEQFNRTWTSATERAAMFRINHYRKGEANGKRTELNAVYE